MLRPSLRHLLPLGLLVAAFATSLAVTGCSDSSPPAAARTGTVSLFVTDAESDAFDEINVTVDEVVLIGGGPQVTIFQGSETFDLKSLEQFSDLFFVAEDVPARTYSKIRLRVSAIELVDDDGDPMVIPVDPPANGKIDLNPRGSFEVKPGGHLVIELDMDAEKSIHLHETGNGEYRFRPVVFVKIREGVTPRRLSRVNGAIRPGSTTADQFTLCRALSVGPVDRRVNTDGSVVVEDEHARVSAGRFWEHLPRGTCILVRLDERTGVFDANGDPIDLELLEGTAPIGIPVTPSGAIDEVGTLSYVTYPFSSQALVTVIGRFAVSGEDWTRSFSGSRHEEDDEPSNPTSLVMQAAVIEEGPIGTFLQLAGWLEPANDQDPADVRRFLPAPGQGFGDSTWLPALLQAGTRFFDGAGEELFADELGEIVSAEIDGVFGALDDTGRLFYKTALVMVGEPNGFPSSGTLEGVVARVDLAARTVEIDLGRPPGLLTLSVPEDLEVQFVYEVGGAVANAFAPLDALAPGTEVAIAAEISSGGVPSFEVRGIVAYGAPSLWPPCLADADCAAGAYCRRPDDHCEWGGVCEPMPQACTQLVDPVCGCDGIVYGNACEAASTGVSLQPNREVCTPPS